ncbi:FAD-dependent monooxygenase [Kribbella sp. NBC_01505]|uniref:FAD-dependent monooxygenase n=1 Tax=Kribbella sp. NBC_01505 TaxID=2903580 RepID=UPI003865D96F
MELIAYFWEQEDAESVAAQLDGTVRRERFQGEDDDEDHPWVVVLGAVDREALDALLAEYDGWLETAVAEPVAAPPPPLPSGPKRFKKGVNPSAGAWRGPAMQTTPLRWEADVVIVGGAVGGASTAHALATLGVSSIVLERTATFPELNRGDILQPLSLGLLEKWGVLPHVKAMGGYDVVASGFYHRVHGFLGEWGFADLDMPHPHQTVLRHTNLHRALYAAFASHGELVSVQRGAQVSSLLFDDSGMRARGVAGRIGGVPFEAVGKVVVAADGPASRIRKAIGIGYDQRHTYDHAYLMPTCPRPNVPELEHRNMRYVGADGLTMLIPLDGGREVRVPFQIPLAEETYWRALEPQELWQRMVERAPVLGSVPGLIEGGMHIYRIHLGHAERYVKANVCLVGDAAHVVPPTLGQGMFMAMLDADILAAVIRRGLDDGDLVGGLQLYDELRRPANEIVLAASHEQTLVQTAIGPEVDAHVLRDFAWLSDPVQRRAAAERISGMLNKTAEQLGILSGGVRQ